MVMRIAGSDRRDGASWGTPGIRRTWREGMHGSEVGRCMALEPLSLTYQRGVPPLVRRLPPTL